MKCIIKYILLISFFFISKMWAQVDNQDLSNVLAQTFANLSSVPSISYNVNITTLEANNITNTYKASVNEVWQHNSYYALYKLNSNQIFFTYANSSGIERFWLGRTNDLPEIKLKDIDTKIFNTAISFVDLVINPLWLSIPVNTKYDQGFFVVQSYNKNKYSGFCKVEYYINKENIPIRILYYNKISNFPVLEVLITDYKKVNNTYVIYKIEYKDNSTKKTTILEKSDVVLNAPIPEWLENTHMLIKDNLNAYHKYFMMTLRNENDIISLNSQDNLYSSNENIKKDSYIDSPKYKDKFIENKMFKEDDLKNDNDKLLRALNQDTNTQLNENNKVLETPKIVAIPKTNKEKTLNTSKPTKNNDNSKKLQEKSPGSKVKNLNKPNNITKKVEKDKHPNNNSKNLPFINASKGSPPQDYLPKELYKEEKGTTPLKESLGDPEQLLPFADKEVENKKNIKKKNTLNNLF